MCDKNCREKIASYTLFNKKNIIMLNDIRLFASRRHIESSRNELKLKIIISACLPYGFLAI